MVRLQTFCISKPFACGSCLISVSHHLIFCFLENNRGFRQATRGADTGAFHHPLFQRDQPDLCLDMVCQRSRDRKSSPQHQQAVSPQTQPAPQRSKGPLKKRCPPQQGANQVASLLTKEALDTMCESQTDSGITVNRRVHVSVVSVEDSASENNSCSDGENSPSFKKILTQQQSPRTSTVTAEASVVQLALLQRDEMERMRLAKAMLFHAYMNVLQATT